MAAMETVVGSEDGYILWRGVANGRDAWMVQQADTDKVFVSRTYRTEADAQRGWARWRATRSDAPPRRVLVEAMAMRKESVA